MTKNTQRYCSRCTAPTAGAPLCDRCAKYLRRDEALLAEYDEWPKPCPFCGSEAQYGRYDISGEHYIKCPNCAIVVMFDVDLSKEDAIKHWNTRRTHVTQPVEGGTQ